MEHDTHAQHVHARTLNLCTHDMHSRTPHRCTREASPINEAWGKAFARAGPTRKIKKKWEAGRVATARPSNPDEFGRLLLQLASWSGHHGVGGWNIWNKSRADCSYPFRRQVWFDHDATCALPRVCEVIACWLDSGTCNWKEKILGSVNRRGKTFCGFLCIQRASRCERLSNDFLCTSRERNSAVAAKKGQIRLTRN